MATTKRLILMVCAIVLSSGLAIKPLKPTLMHAPKSLAASTESANPAHISDAYARQLAIQILGPEAAHKIRYQTTNSELSVDSAPVPTSSSTSEYSSVWAGYISDVFVGPYLAFQVTARFNVFADTATQPVMSSWVGIGGVYGTHNLIQAGY